MSRETTASFFSLSECCLSSDTMSKPSRAGVLMLSSSGLGASWISSRAMDSGSGAISVGSGSGAASTVAGSVVGTCSSIREAGSITSCLACFLAFFLSFFDAFRVIVSIAAGSSASSFVDSSGFTSDSRGSVESRTSTGGSETSSFGSEVVSSVVSARLLSV